jgi:predicted ArsR family transcriptional regulator
VLYSESAISHQEGQEAIVAIEHREQGETRQQILMLLRRRGQLTAAELSEELGIGAVGVRQHLALLERDGLVHTAGVRRGVGRPSHLYGLAAAAEELFPRRYDKLALDALAFVREASGDAGVDRLFGNRAEQLARQYAPRLAGKSRAEQVAELASLLTEQGYMCEWEALPDGSFLLVEHNCPVDCVARDYPQACANELTLYETLLGTPIIREETIAAGGRCCRYHIGGEQSAA